MLKNESPYLKLLRGLRPGVILCGFSGGADSAALLLSLLEWAPELGFVLRAVHFQHGLRGAESIADAEWCRRFCAGRGVEFEEIPLAVDSHRRTGENLEAAARRLRMAQWERLNAELRPQRPLVALGHHNDDAVEGFLLRFFRGANASGLAALRPVREIRGVTYVRPLLPWDRRRIIEFLASRGVDSWRHDSSNDDPRFKRNFLRNQILPNICAAIPHARGGMRRSLDALQDDAEFIESAAAREFAAIVDGHGQMAAAKFAGLHAALRPRVLRLWLRSLVDIDAAPGVGVVERLATEIGGLEDGVRKRLPIGRGGEVLVHRGLMRYLPPPVAGGSESAPPAARWNWRQTPELLWGKWRLTARLGAPPAKFPPEDGHEAAAYFAAVAMPGDLVVRAWRHGERMTPFGANSPVKLKKLFAERGVPAELRARYPLLADVSGNILWIPGVRRSNLHPLADGGGGALVIECSLNPRSRNQGIQ